MGEKETQNVFDLLDEIMQFVEKVPIEGDWKEKKEMVLKCGTDLYCALKYTCSYLRAIYPRFLKLDQCDDIWTPYCGPSCPPRWNPCGPDPFDPKKREAK